MDNNLRLSTIALKNINNFIVKKVCSDVKKIGGTIWMKGGHKRAYFPDLFPTDLNVDHMQQAYNPYIDLISGNFVCDVSKSGNTMSARDYWIAYRDYMTSTLNIMRQ